MYSPLPLDYYNVIRQHQSVRLTIMGKDPYPSHPTGIPFCKATWDEQYAYNCSGAYVLSSLGFERDSLHGFDTPANFFMKIAEFGIVFLNLSYHYLNGNTVDEHRDKDFLVGAAEINLPILERSSKIILCGEARFNSWYCGVFTNQIEVCHPDIRNSIRPNEQLNREWQEYWSPNRLRDQYHLQNIVSSINGIGR